MAVVISFTDQALCDIDEIAAYINYDSKHYAMLQVAKFFSRVEMLQIFPYSGRVVPEIKIKSIRELIEGNYRIIYRIVNKNKVHILTVHHSRRKLTRATINKQK